MQKGPAPRNACRVELGLLPNSDWDRCENALNGNAAAQRIAVVTSHNAWYPTSASELTTAVQEATVSSGNWPSIIGVNY